MAEMLRDAGYATAIFGKWHLGAQPYSQPQNKGFDEFYGIPPGDTWDAFLMIPQGRQTKTLDIPLDKGPQIVEAKRGEPLKTVKPYTAEVRREIDWELVDRGIDFMQAPEGGGQAVLPLSADFPDALSEPALEAFRGRIAHRPVRRFLDGRRCHRRQDARCLEELGLEKDTIVVFASDNGPQGDVVREFGGDMPDMGSPGPLPRRARRRERRLDPHRRDDPLAGSRFGRESSYAMFSIMDFFPTFAHLAGGKVPDDRPIDGVDQTDLLLGKSDTGRREQLADLRRPRLSGGTHAI